MADSFIGGGNRRTRRKPPTCRKLLTNFITSCCIEHTSPLAGFELTTLVVKIWYFVLYMKPNLYNCIVEKSQFSTKQSILYFWNVKQTNCYLKIIWRYQSDNQNLKSHTISVWQTLQCYKWHNDKQLSTKHHYTEDKGMRNMLPH